MKFGVRECANIVFRAKQPIRIGTATFQTGQPVLYIDTATTSSIEQATTTVYAQGGRGNARLLAWEGEKTLTFSFTDALLSPIGFSILSGAGLFKRGNGNDAAGETNDLVHFHMTSAADLSISGTTGTIDLRSAISEFGSEAAICVENAPIYIMGTESDGSLTGDLYTGTISGTGILTINDIKLNGVATTQEGSVMVDYYVDLPGANVWEADISPETFGGNYYVEADTLFRDQHTGKDLPANLTFPNVRLQSNFTMTFAGTGDPSTFDFTMDAFPDYTYFDKKKKVLCVMQIVDSTKLGSDLLDSDDPVMYHSASIQDKETALNDSNLTADEKGDKVARFGITADLNSDADGVSNVYIQNIGDAVNLKNRLTILDSSGNDISDTVKPVFSIVDASGSNTGNANGEITLDATDGYVVGKVATSGSSYVAVSASLTSTTSLVSSASTNPAAFNIYVVTAPPAPTSTQANNG